MQTFAVLPVKSFGSAKQRLSGLLGSGFRQALAQAMLSDVLSAIRRVRGVHAIAVVTADRVAESAAMSRGVQVLRDREEAGQSSAALVGVRHAIASGFERVLLVPGDTPLLDAAELDRLLQESEERRLGVAVVPDRHGTGTNALVLSPADAIEPSFGPDSRARHVAAAQAAGIPHSVEPVASLALDVDTPEDLAELSGLLDACRGQAPMTRGAIRQLDRSHARPERTPVQA